MRYFKVKAKHKLSEMEVGARIETSDYAQITPDGHFVQLEFIEEEEKTIVPFDVKPGIFTIVKGIGGLNLQNTNFVNDNLLTSIVNTQQIVEKADCFFRNLHVYKEHGFEVAKRALLIYGPPGTGKTAALNLVAKKYSEDGKTAVVVWTTDKFEAHEVKDFIKRFNYVGVEKLILVVEDIGGIEMDQKQMASDSSLLSLLDNQEKTFRIPVLILATTNFPENFQGNLTNRPQRFDDKIRIPAPSGADRRKLLNFFSKEKASEDCLSFVEQKKCDVLTTAHLKESVIRAAIYEKPLLEVLDDLLKEIELYNRGFAERGKGIGFVD